MLMSVPLFDELYSKKRKAHFIASSSVHRMLMRVPLSDNLLLKNCKAHFTTLSRVRRVLISAPLSGDLLSKYNIRVLMSAPVYDKIVQIYHPNRVIYIKRITYEKVNGSIVNVGVIPSKVVITKPRLDKDHKSLLDHKAKGHVVAEKNNVF